MGSVFPSFVSPIYGQDRLSIRIISITAIHFYYATLRCAGA